MSSNQQENRRFKDFKQILVIIVFGFLGLFLLHSVIFGGRVDLTKYFPSRDITAIYYTFSPDGEAVFKEERIITKGSKSNRLDWIINSYVNKNGTFSSTGTLKGIYEVGKNKVTSTETWGGFNTGKKQIILSNEKSWARFPEDKNMVNTYLSGKIVTLTIEAGVFRDCLEVITETTFDKGTITTKDYYAPNIGYIVTLIKDIGDDDFISYRELMTYEY